MTELRSTRRRAWPWLLAAGLLGLGGCTGLGTPALEVDGHPCVSFRRTHRLSRMCAAQPAPPPQVQREARRFEPEREAALVFVHWLERAGATRPLVLRVDGRAVADLLPGGLVRLRLSPGRHELAVAWNGQAAPLTLVARAGQVEFAEVGVRFKFWDIGFGWEAADPERARTRAAAARVVGDVDGRREPAPAGGSVTTSG